MAFSFYRARLVDATADHLDRAITIDGTHIAAVGHGDHAATRIDAAG